MQSKVIDGYQLSSQQTHIWLLQQDDGSHAYKAQSAILIEGDIDVATLKAAISEVVNRHEILRTNFHLIPGIYIPLQTIIPEQVVTVPEIDLSDCSSREKSDRFEDYFRKEALRRFDFKSGPSAQFCLLRLSASERILVTSLPAVCADSRTLKNLFQEMVRTYVALLGNELLPDQHSPPVQYVDFAEWQGEELEREGERAKEPIRPVPDCFVASQLRLGLERESDTSFSPEPRYITFVLDSETTIKIDHISSTQGTSPDIFLLACWQLLVWNLTGHKDITIDMLCDSRSLSDLWEAIGAFDCFCPVQSHLEQDYQFTELLEITNQSVSLTNSRLNYVLRQRSKGIGDGGLAERAHALSFEYEEWPREEFAGSVKFSYWKQYCHIDRFKLKLCGHRKAEGLTIELQYDPVIFSRESIELIQERYLTLIQSAVKHEQAMIGDLEIVGPRELEKLLVGWNETENELTANTTFHELVAEQARLRPESIAVIYKDEQLSYQELESRANRLANYLRRFGLAPDCVVGLYLERSTEMVIGLLGIVKAGGAYLPLEVGQPVERLKVMLENSGARVIVTRQETVGHMFGGHEIVLLDREYEQIAGYSRATPKVSLSRKNLAYVIYTSGSTGKPKGVMIEHGSVVNLLEGLKSAIYQGVEAELTVSLNAPLAFDASVKQVIQLARGHRLCIIPEAERVDGKELIGYIRSYGIEVLDCTPSHLRLLLKAGLGRREGDPGIVLVGGEAIDAQGWGEMLEGKEVRYHNVYGPTECTVDATTYEVSEGREPTIGRPINNTRIYLLDEEGGVSPIGVVGEIYIGGAGVARGYVGDGEMTGEKFVPDPLGKRRGERLYRTGDLGRYLADGRIVYEGRRDEQLKVRGYRIELGEIEEVLRSHPGVSEAVVTTIEDEPGQKRIVGYVVRRQEKIIEGSRRRRLPNGMAVVEQNGNETEYLYEEIFKKKSYFKHGITLPENGCVFDVGANIGLFSLFVSLNRKDVTVHAFEPIKPIFETLRINARLYGGARVKLYEIGLGDKEKRELYTYYRGYSMMSGESRYATAAGDIEVIKTYLRNERGPQEAEELLKKTDEMLAYRFEEEKYECEVRKLTDVMREERIERIDLLKVDVQRAEMDVLRGLEEEDWGKIAQIVMEVHDQKDDESQGRLEQIENMLKEKGYVVTIEQDELLNGTDRYNIYARRAGRPNVEEALAWTDVRVDEPWEEITEGDLKSYVRDKLPEYMTPAAIVVMEELPLMRNGKIDRGALPRPEEIRKQGEIEAGHHQDAYEELISGIWKELLKVERVRSEDNFFELGGHSLLAMQVLSRVRDVFDVEIGVRSIFEEATLAGLARKIEESMSRGRRDEIPPLVRASRRGSLPLSFAQQRLWFLNQLEPESAFYNSPMGVRLRGRLNLAGLKQTVEEVVRRHEVLRTTYQMVGDSAVQVIRPRIEGLIDVVDLSGLEEEERAKEEKRQTSREAVRSFDLSSGPVIRAKVLRIKAEEHVALFTMHHIVSDGWSMGVLVKEIASLYEAYSRGDASPLPELEIQYADYALWQRQWLQGKALERQLEYWRRQLGEGLPTLELATDRPRPKMQSYRGASEVFSVSEEASRKLRELSRRQGCTMFMTLLAAFKVLLMRCSGQSDVVVGATVANRNREETEKLIGFFVNQLVLRTDLGGDPNFVELMQRVRKTALEAYTHQDVPFERLVEELQPKRNLSHSPLFQVVFGLQNAIQGVLNLPSLSLSIVNLNSWTTKFDLTVNLIEDGQRIVGVATYNTDLFNVDTIIHMTNYYKTILEGILSNPEMKVVHLPLIGEAEHAQLLMESAGPRKTYPSDSLIYELFEEQTQLRPDSIAIVFEDKQLTYRELNTRSNQLARYLQQLGVGPDVRVGICLERSIEIIIGLLAILKAGGAYMPIDPAYPLERQSFMLEDGQIPVLLTSELLAGALPETWAQMVYLDRDWYDISGREAERADSGTTPDNIAYVVYTSGSTGAPKGVEICHRSVIRLLFEIDYVRLDATQRILQLSPISFDASTFEIWGALLHGGACILCPAKIPTFEELRQLTERERVSTMWMTSSLYNVVIDNSPDALKDVRQLLIGGETLSPVHVERGLRLLHPTKIINGYGPTESATFACCHQITEADVAISSVPIGKAIANTEVFILDNYLQLVPKSIHGELCIGGDGLARDYLNRPDITAEKFVPHPFGGELGQRLYKTGDVARYRCDGNIDFLGRKDDQVKVRGYRIELGEIEAALLSYDKVKRAVAIVREESSEHKILIAYIIAVGGAAVDGDELQEYLSKKLPDYMVPKIIVQLDHLPYSANGKIDKRALPRPEEIGKIGGVYVAPQTPVEEIVAEIFSNVLRINRVSVSDNFFDLGGHSLLATQVISRVRKIFELDLPLIALFEHPTVSALSLAIEERLIEEVDALSEEEVNNLLQVS